MLYKHTKTAAHFTLSLLTVKAHFKFDHMQCAKITEIPVEWKTPSTRRIAAREDRKKTTIVHQLLCSCVCVCVCVFQMLVAYATESTVYRIPSSNNLISSTVVLFANARVSSFYYYSWYSLVFIWCGANFIWSIEF